MDVPSDPQPARLVGRAGLLDDLTGRVAEGPARLVTLTGPGGVGKTSVARALARTSGAALVDLSAARTGPEFWSALAAALTAEPAPGEPLAAAVGRALAGPGHLLVLDNLEQIAEAAAAVAELLTACPSLRVLATSRTRLGLSDEAELPVPPLSLAPEEDGLAPAVALFVERARAANPAFRLQPTNAAAVHAICRRLDGLPLAIELAAARSGVLSPDALLARLERGLEVLSAGPGDAPDRQRTVRAAIVWSYDLLTAPARTTFRHLGVFAGGCTLEALEAVLPVEARPELLAQVDELVRHALLRTGADANGAPRLVMLETIHAAAAKLLDEAGELPGARRAHAAWLAAFAADAGPRLKSESHAQLHWWNRIAVELGNIRAAAEWLEAVGEQAAALRILVDLDWFWTEYTLLPEGIERIEGVLTRDSAGAIAPTDRARGLTVLAMLYDILSDVERCTRRAEEAAAIWRAAGNDRELALALYALAGSAHERGDHDVARAYVTEALEHARAADDNWHQAACLVLLGNTTCVLDRDYARAIALYDEAVERFRSVGEQGRITGAVCGSALASLLQGDLPRAAARYRSGLEIEEGLSSDRVYGGWLFAGFGLLAAAYGQDVLAVRLCAAGDAEATRTGFTPRSFTRDIVATRLAEIRGRLGEPAFAAAWVAGQRLGFEEAAALCRLIEAPAPVASAVVAELAALSRRELDVLRLLAAGRTDAEIADQLFISRRTASQHVSSILGKLQVTSRAAAAAIAARAGLA